VRPPASLPLTAEETAELYLAAADRRCGLEEFVDGLVATVVARPCRGSSKEAALRLEQKLWEAEADGLIPAAHLPHVNAVRVALLK
jgi:hypothetical protein